MLINQKLIKMYTTLKLYITIIDLHNLNFYIEYIEYIFFVAGQ